MKPIEVAIVLEIVIVNMLTLNRCCRKKYSYPAIISVLGCFTLIITLIGYFAISRFSFYGNGNGLFVLFGFFYLIPLSCLYEEKIAQLYTIICMSWVYTLGVFALSVQIGKVLDHRYFYEIVFCIETALFLSCTVTFHKIIVKRYIYILENTKNHNHSLGFYLTLVSNMQFFTILGTNFVFTIEKGSIIKAGVVLFLVVTMFLTYCILYQVVERENMVSKLNKVVYEDALTGIGNRLRLYKDLQELLASDTEFFILFMDLDNFKQINDQYGHLVGDQYLQHFAKVSSRIVGSSGCVYRFGGDEFFVIYRGTKVEELVKQLELCEEWKIGAPCDFNQVSIGVQAVQSSYRDINSLLSDVDKLMYQKKKDKQDVKDVYVKS